MNHHRMSERRACKAIGFFRMPICYETRRGDDRGLRERMKVLRMNAAVPVIDTFMGCLDARDILCIIRSSSGSIGKRS